MSPAGDRKHPARLPRDRKPPTEPTWPLLAIIPTCIALFFALPHLLAYIATHLPGA